MADSPLVVITKPKILSVIKDENKNIKIDIICQPIEDYFIDYSNLEDSFEFCFIYKNFENIEEKYKKNLEKNIKRDILDRLKKQIQEKQ
jgi:hypothetical protein